MTEDTTEAEAGRHWRPARAPAKTQVPPDGPQTPMPLALWRGLQCRCPGCGKSPIFSGYLTVRGPCPICRTPLDEARADDFPPYVTIFIAGHIIVPGMLACEALFNPRMWVEAVIWIPMTLLVTTLLLRPVKGAIVGLMLKLDMRKPSGEV